MFSSLISKLSLQPTEAGHALSLPDYVTRGDGFDREYMGHVLLLWKNPALMHEVDETMKMLLDGAMQSEDILDVKACRWAGKALLAFMDRLGNLAHAYEEELEREGEARKNPEAAYSDGLTD